MKFGPKRGHVLFIFEHVIKDFGLLILAGMIFLVTRNPQIFTENIPLVAIVVFGPINRVIKYLTTTYAIDDEKLIIKQGWIAKKNIEIPLSTITTVDVSQSLINRVFNTYSLRADNASNLSDSETKIKMTFGKEDAFLVKSLLLSGKTTIDGFNLDASGEEEKKATGDAYIVKAKDLLIMGAIKSKGAFFIQASALLITGVSILSQMIDISSKGIASTLIDLAQNFGMTIMSLIGIFVFFLIAIVCGAVGTLIKYYDFHVLDNGESLRIEYGLITKKKFTIHKRKITGFFYEQSMVMNLLDTGVLHLFAIGYGQSGDEQTSEEPMLFPLLPKRLLTKVMGDILPEMKETSQYERPERKAFRYFFFRGGVVTAIILMAASIYVSLTYAIASTVWIFGVLCIIYTAVSSVLRYKHTGIYGNKKHISFTFGGWNKTFVFVKSNNVESISERASYFKHKKGVTNISIGYIAPHAEARNDAKNLSLGAYEQLKSTLIY
ncbi:putative membrane protein [Clostridiales Family XIII bacterium PM5-7]